MEHGERLRDQSDYTGALTEFLRAVEIDPSNELASQDIQATKEKLNAQNPGTAAAPRSSDDAFEELAPPVQLKPISNEPLTLHMVQDSRVVYQAVGKAAGINVLFDPAYSSKSIQVDLNNVTLYDALRIIATVSNTFWRPVTTNTIFVAENSRSKHTELDEQAVETFYLHNVSQQNDFTEVQQVLRNLFQTARINGVSGQNAIVMRGTPDEIMLARRLVSNLDKARPEVVIDVAVMEVSRDLLRNIGVQLPQTASISFQPANANLNNTNTGTTARHGNHDQLNVHDDEQPYAGQPGASELDELCGDDWAGSGGSAADGCAIEDYSEPADTGVGRAGSEAEDRRENSDCDRFVPDGRGNGDCEFAGEHAVPVHRCGCEREDEAHDPFRQRCFAEKRRLRFPRRTARRSIGGITEPIITQRTADQTIRLKDGEANLLGGILQHQTTFTISGTPGLGELPLIKYLFSTQQKEVTDDEIVFLLIPHVVRREQITPEDVQEIDTGTSSSVQVRPVDAMMAAPTPPASMAQANQAVGNQAQASVPAFGGTQAVMPAPIHAHNWIGTGGGRAGPDADAAGGECGSAGEFADHPGAVEPEGGFDLPDGGEHGRQQR